MTWTRERLQVGKTKGGVLRGDLSSILPYVIAAAILWLLPHVLGNDNNIRLAALMAIYSIAAIGMNIAVGYARLLTLAQGSFMAIGAYGWTLLVVRADLNGLLALVLAPLICAAIGATVGLATSRVTGHYFIVVTLGAQIGIMTVISAWGALTGGVQGFPAVPSLVIGGFDTLMAVDLLLVAGSLLIASLYCAQRLRASRVGRALVMLGESEPDARAAGIRVTAYRTIAMAICSAFAGLAGVLYASYIGFLAPESFGVNLSITLLAMLVLGGLGSNVGAVLGSILVVMIQDRTQSLAEISSLIYGVLIVVVVVAFRGGILGALQVISRFTVSKFHRRESNA